MEPYGLKQLSPRGGVIAIGTYRDPLRAFLRYDALVRQKRQTGFATLVNFQPIAPIVSVRRVADDVMSRYMPEQGSGLIGIIELFSARPDEFAGGATLMLVLPRPVFVPVSATLYGDAGFEPIELPVMRVTSTEMIATLPPNLAECAAVAVAVDGT